MRADNLNIFIKSLIIKTNPKFIKLVVKVRESLRKILIAAFGKHYNLEIISIKEFSNKFSCNYINIKESEIYYNCYPDYLSNKKHKKSKQFIDRPEIYIAEIMNATVIGDNHFILKDNYCIYDIPYYPHASDFNLKYGSVKKINRSSIEIVFVRSKTIIHKAISIVGHASNNYYHFMIDLLSRLYYIDQNEEYDDYDLVVDKRAYEKYKNIIDTYNIKKRKIIVAKKDTAYSINQLIFPSQVSFNKIYSKNLEKNIFNGNIYDAEPFQKFKETIFKSLKITLENRTRKIFISRKDSVRNNLVNEDEIAEIFIENGFEIIVPSEYSFVEQVKIFSTTNVLAGAEGAAFTNMLFMPKNSIAICIVDYTKKQFMVSCLATALGIKSIYLEAIKIGEKRHFLSKEYAKEFLEGFNL